MELEEFIKKHEMTVEYFNANGDHKALQMSNEEGMSIQAVYHEKGYEYAIRLPERTEPHTVKAFQGTTLNQLLGYMAATISAITAPSIHIVCKGRITGGVEILKTFKSKQDAESYAKSRGFGNAYVYSTNVY